ncbi:unnamed protein product (macronuclear) [Paramecium tetraurelia]|uniref:Thioredoxin domain-containing protein n=1 Tax=Paramecium tetraurelia TaxID=5888 RepID=A0D5U4_PARTE|nr:uncharacterized protein GSPATT00013841001 [Paramecium tetraurelia]CAK78411.1 unnamed protein product [Paramecium tetraurelia]|eukprot:XP_001445808.1 hypothetical protein (macronuclear) [Paramecium tetraurelia strain d4-2]
MFRTIRLIPKLLKFTQVATCLALIYNQQSKLRCAQINTQTIKIINQKDVDALLANPQDSSNTIIILNKNIIEDLPKNLSANLFICDSSENDYDLIAVNQHRYLLLKIRGEEDYLKLLNFLTPLQTLDSKQDAINLIDQMDAQVVLSYIPSIINAEEQINKFEPSQKYDPQQLEEQLKELRIHDFNREAQYYIIKDKNVAEEFNLSIHDIGEIYILKQPSIFNSKESSFHHNGKEYFMKKVEPDQNIKRIDTFIIEKKHDSLSSYLQGSKEETVQQQNLQGFVNKLTLTANNYVNYVFNKQQMDSQLLIYKQMGVKYILFYHSQNDVNEKIIKKLINVKKSVNNEQQQQFAIVYSDNIDLIQTYFGIVDNGITDDVRLLDLNQNQTYTISFNIVQLGQKEYNYDQYKLCKRYSFGDKITVNRLKQFIVQTTNLKIQNIEPQDYNREEYYEKTFVKMPFDKLQTITANNLELSGYDFIYFYKPGCAACHTVAETLEKIAWNIYNPNPYRVKNISNFKKISLKKYNILNESQMLPSPIQAPQIYILHDGKMQKADLVQNKINPGDESKMLHFLTKLIDNL